MFYDNVIYNEEWCGPFEQLGEYPYLQGIFAALKQKMQAHFESYYFYIYSSNGVKNKPKPILLKTDKPAILVYISDESGDSPAYLLPYFTHVFKCYINSSDETAQISPLPLGYNRKVLEQPIIPIHQREYIVFFSGYLNRTRYYLYQELTWLRFFPKAIFDRVIGVLMPYLSKDISRAIPKSCIMFSDGFNTSVSGLDYAKTLANSSLLICPPGYESNETTRHYEAMRQGCIIISFPLPDNHFFSQAPMVIIHSWSELRPTIKKLLSNQREMERLHKETLSWWNNICCEEAVATYMYKKIQGH